MALHDVELVEDEPERPAAPAEEPPARSWLRRHPAVVAVLVGVLVLAVGTGALLDHRARQRDAARVAALREVAGVLTPVDPALPVTERITEPEDDGPLLGNRALLGGVVAGDVTVVGSWTADADAVVSGLAGADGTEVWRTTVEPPAGAAVDAGANAWCADPDRDVVGRPVERTRERADDLVGCVAQWSRRFDASVDAEGGMPVVAAALELDPADGRVVRRVDLPDGADVTRADDGWVTSARAGAELVVTHLAGDGTPRWATTLEAAPAVAGSTWSYTTVADDRVLVVDEGGAVVLDRADGAVLARHPGQGTSGGQLRPDGSVLLSDGGGPRPTHHLHRPDGTSTDLDGQSVVWPVVDDGSLGDLLLTSTDDAEPATALRDADGRVRWRVDAAVTTAMVVDGTVVAVDDTELVRLDGADGHVRWRVPLPGRGDRRLLTDGAVVLVGTSGRLDAWTYDGAPAWSGHLRRGDDDDLTVTAGAPAPSPSGRRPAGLGADAWWVGLPDGRLAAQVFTDDGAGELLVVG